MFLNNVIICQDRHVKHLMIDNLNLLYTSDGRRIFLKAATAHLRQHLMTKQEITFCAELLSDVVNLTYKESQKFNHTMVNIKVV